MATVIKEVASFDVDTKAAQRSINGYIDSLQKLEKQREKNIKLGKSTVQVNKQIDKTIDQINASLKQVSTTRKGQLAQLEATRRAQERISKQTQKQLVLEKRVEKQSKSSRKSIQSQRRAFGELKFLAVGAAVAIVAALGQLGEAIDSVNNVLFPTIGLQNKVAEATKGAALEYVKEKAELDNLFETAANDNISREERVEAIKKINKEYGDYLPNLLTETSSLEDLKVAQDLATAAILKRIVAQTKLAIAEQLIQQLIESQINQANRTVQANAGVVQGFENVIKLFGNLLAPGVATAAQFIDVSESIAGAGNAMDKLSSDSARAQLTLLSSGGDKFLIDFLKSFDGLSDILKGFESGVKDAGDGTGSTGKKIKDLSGTIAGLTAQLSAAKKVLTEGIQITDEASLIEQTRLIDGIEQRIKELKEFLDSLSDEPIEFGELEFFEPDLDTLFTLDKDRVAESIKKGLQGLTITDLRLKLEQVGLEGLIDLNALEVERNAALLIFKGTAEERNDLNEQFNQRRLARERQTARAVIELQLQILKIERQIADEAGESLNKIDTAIAKLQLSLTELDAQEVNVTIDADISGFEDKAKRTKEVLSEIVSGIEELGGQIISFFAQQAAATLAQLESDISRQESILGELLSNQATANAQQVQLERDRLDALVAQRKKATEEQAIIAATEIGLNLAIAVARAAAEGGGIGSAFTIAALLLAAGIGFLQARQQAQQAFASGTDRLTAKGDQRSDGGISIIAHKDEAIIQADKNKEYHPVVKVIRRGSIPAKAMNDFVKNYGKRTQGNRLKVPSMYRQMEAAGITLNASGGDGLNNKFMEAMLSEQKQTRKAIETLPIHITNFSERGVTKMVTTNQENAKRNNKRFR